MAETLSLQPTGVQIIISDMKTCSTYKKLEGEEKVNCIKMQSLWKGPSYSMVSCLNSQDK